MHRFCFARYRRSNQQCPSCSKAWPADIGDGGLLAVGEKAVKDGQDDQRSRRRRQSTPSSEEEDSEAPEAGASSLPKQRMKRLPAQERQREPRQ